MNERMDDLADRIDALGDEIDELAFDLLREASRRGEARPASDKSLMQARRALVKASAALRSAASGRGAEPIDGDEG